MSETACAICDGQLLDRLAVIAVPDRFERWAGVAPDGYHRTWLGCRQCGSATNVLPPNSKSLLSSMEKHYYEIDFANADLSEKYNRIMSLPPADSDNAQRVNRIINYMKKWPGSPQNEWMVADIGSGLGVFLAYFSQMAKQFVGSAVAVEPDPKAAAHLRSLEIFEVIESAFPSQQINSNINLLTLNKVLEHISNPVAFMLDIHTVMHETGVIYIEVPDVITTRLRNNTDNILGVMHRHLYSPYGLGHLLNRTNFEILALDRIVEPSGKLTLYAFATPRNAFASLAGKI